MNPRAIINFVRSPTGATVMFLLLMTTVLIVAYGFQEPPQIDKLSTPLVTKPQIVETVERDMVDFPAPAPTKEQQKVPVQQIAKEPVQAIPPPLPPMSLFAANPSPQEKSNKLGKNYAPFGRPIRCELVFTVDSSNIDTPVIGLVTDDVWHGGRRIIPAGTEVHGRARIGRTRERIFSSGEWNIVWQTGEELTVKGIALDRETISRSNGWGITDGSAGLRGKVIKSDEMAEIKLFAATFLSGAADALTERESTVFGSQTLPSLRNAPFEGAQDVLNTYAQQILQTIQREGIYVRVPAGKQFYLYVTQTIDAGIAVVGGASSTSFSTTTGNPDTP